MRSGRPADRPEQPRAAAARRVRSGRVGTASQYDAASGKYQLGANNDGPFFIREEDGRFVLAEMDGPGVSGDLVGQASTGAEDLP